MENVIVRMDQQWNTQMGRNTGTLMEIVIVRMDQQWNTQMGRNTGTLMENVIVRMDQQWNTQMGIESGIIMVITILRIQLSGKQIDNVSPVPVRCIVCVPFPWSIYFHWRSWKTSSQNRLLDDIYIQE
jgi:hypothetical protein